MIFDLEIIFRLIIIIISNFDACIAFLATNNVNKQRIM